MFQLAVRPSSVNWAELHALLRASYAYMEGRIDPPSSLLSMSASDLEEKATAETLITVSSAGHLVGCLFCRADGDWLYVGKMAVAADHRRSGLGTMMIDEARVLARDLDLDGLELETRIELTENHRAFARLGFVKIADQSHKGYDRVTSIGMRAPLPH